MSKWKKHYKARAVCYNDDCHIDLGSHIMETLLNEYENVGYVTDMPYCPFCGERMKEWEVTA